MTGDPTEMMITWSTFNDTKESLVQYGFKPNHLSMQAKGSRTLFVDGGSEKHTQYIHRVKMTGLKTGYKYCKFVWVGWVAGLVTNQSHQSINC